MPLKLWKRPDAINGNWYVTGTVSVFRDGRERQVKIKRQSTKTSDRGEADAIRLQIEARYKRANYENQDVPPTVAEVAASYIAGSTKRSQLRYLEPIIKRLGEYEAPELTQELVDREGKIAYPGVQPSTLRRQWHGPIITLLNYVGIEARLKKPKGSEGVTRFLSPRQVDAMILTLASTARTTPWQLALLEVLICAGSRVGETLLADTRDLNMEYGTIRFVPTDTKNNKQRTVKLLPRALAALSRLPNLADAGPIIRRPDGQPYTVKRGLETRGVSLAFAETAAKATFNEHFNPHLLRHSMATWRLDQTKDYMAVREAGGWSSIKLLERYAHVAPGIGLEAAKFGWDWTTLSADSVQTNFEGEIIDAKQRRI